jgi:hypothetical protein
MDPDTCKTNGARVIIDKPIQLLDLIKVMIKKIISGGQTGAGQAALDAAIRLEFPYGGWISKGRRTEDGILPYPRDLSAVTVMSLMESLVPKINSFVGKDMQSVMIMTEKIQPGWPID